MTKITFIGGGGIQLTSDPLVQNPHIVEPMFKELMAANARFQSV